MDNREKILEKAKLEASNIKMMVNDPSLKGKITSNITDPGGSVYWYIRFNTPLDPTSVTKYTMNVTELNGYILNVIITYDSTRNLIVLNPTDLYRQNEYYILNVSKKVRSGKGKQLSKPVYIMFKLIGDKISEFEILKDTARVPKPRKKPANVRRAEVRELIASKIYAQAQDEKVLKTIGKPTLMYGQIAIKLQLAILGLIWFVLSLFFDNFFVTTSGIVLIFIGFIHVVSQLFKKKVLASILYDIGVMRFNSGKYEKAQKTFIKANQIDPQNEFAEYALTKVKRYI